MSTFKIPLSSGIHTRNRFSTHTHVKLSRNYEGFFEWLHCEEFFGFCFGLGLVWIFLLLMLPFVLTTLFSNLLFYLTFPSKIYHYRIFNVSVLLRLHTTPWTSKNNQRDCSNKKYSLHHSFYVFSCAFPFQHLLFFNQKVNYF